MTPAELTYQAASHYFAKLKDCRIEPRLIALFTECFEYQALTWYEDGLETDPIELADREANAVAGISRFLPPAELLRHGHNLPLQGIYDIQCATRNLDYHYWGRYVDYTLGFDIPESLRNEHAQIIAKSGHGKTQLFQSLILDNLEENAAIVVIDSQRDMINTLASRVPQNRLVLVDPETCPPMLNIFARKTVSEEQVSDALGMYEYIFSALEAKLTSKQALVYRMLARLCLAIPTGNLNTLMQLLEPGGCEPYQEYIDQLPPAAQTFFTEYQARRSNQYNETRQEVLRRVITVLERETFAKMLNAPQNRLELKNELDKGKIILVSTHKALLKDAAPLFGRIFLAEVMQAVMSRRGNRKRVYVYIDEFADYAEDSPMLLDLFKQSRKYNCGLTIAHQELQDLPPALASAIATNTSIKFVGRVSAPDRNTLAREMRTEPPVLDMVGRGEYTVAMEGYGLYPYRVKFGRLEALPMQRTLAEIQADMRERYGFARPTKPTKRPEPLPEHRGLPKPADARVPKSHWLPPPARNDPEDMW